MEPSTDEPSKPATGPEPSKPKPITYKEFAAGKPEPDPSWTPPESFGTALSELRVADSDPSCFVPLKDALLKLADYLNDMEPLEAMFRERQIMAILKAKRVRQREVFIKMARKQARMTKKAEKPAGPASAPQ